MFEGYGKLVAKDTVEVNGERVTGEYIILGTGSYARTLPGLEIRRPGHHVRPGPRASTGCPSP